MGLNLDAKRPALIMLIGPPGSGKSTWRENYIQERVARRRPISIISTDDMIEEYAKERSLNYSTAFQEISAAGEMKLIESMAMSRFSVTAEIEMCDIIIDRTNMRVKSRAKFLEGLPKKYQKVGVVFECERSLLETRLSNRATATGKSIPDNVVADMISGYEPPTSSEFDLIVTVVGK